MVTSNEVEDDLVTNIVDKKQVVSRAQYLSRAHNLGQMYHTSKIKLQEKFQPMKTYHKSKLLEYSLHVHESKVTANDFQAIYTFISATSNNPMQFSEWNSKRSAWINLELIKQHHTHFVHSLGKSLWEFTQAFEVGSASTHVRTDQVLVEVDGLGSRRGHAARTHSHPALATDSRGGGVR